MGPLRLAEVRPEVVVTGGLIGCEHERDSRPCGVAYEGVFYFQLSLNRWYIYYNSGDYRVESATVAQRRGCLINFQIALCPTVCWRYPRHLPAFPSVRAQS